jgi:hypothetical protein
VQVDGNQKTVGTINFSSPEQVTIDCCGVLVLQNAAGTSSLHRASINVFAGSHLINTTLRLESNTTVNVVPPDSTLTMGANRGAEAHRLTKTGAGKLKLSALDVSDLIISAGSVEFQPLTSQKRAATLTIADGTTLDMTDNDLELTAGSQAALDAIEDLIVRGRSGGSWGGTGITSSAARDNPLRTTTLAAIINDNGQGQPISLLFEPGSVAIKYTWYGDTDLDDDVDADDYAQIDQGFAQGLSGWRFGDFDYSGSVNADDFFLIDRAFADQDVTLPGFAPASVPEPSALITLTSTLLLAAAGRYRGWREIIELP